MLPIFSVQHREKKSTLLIFLLEGVCLETADQCEGLTLSLSLFFFLVTKHHYVHSASLVFVFFVLHPVVFRPYYQCKRG